VQFQAYGIMEEDQWLRTKLCPKIHAIDWSINLLILEYIRNVFNLSSSVMLYSEIDFERQFKRVFLILYTSPRFLCVSDRRLSKLIRFMKVRYTFVVRSKTYLILCVTRALLNAPHVLITIILFIAFINQVVWRPIWMNIASFLLLYWCCFFTFNGADKAPLDPAARGGGGQPNCRTTKICCGFCQTGFHYSDRR
jgi:hypothetical protein